MCDGGPTGWRQRTQAIRKALYPENLKTIINLTKSCLLKKKSPCTSNTKPNIPNDVSDKVNTPPTEAGWAPYASFLGWPLLVR